MRWLILTLLLVGCDSSPTKEEIRAKAEWRAERAKRSELAAQQPPKVVRHRMESGEMLVMDVIVGGGPRFVETQKCFVWRDTEFKTTALSCGAAAGFEGTADPQDLR